VFLSGYPRHKSKENEEKDNSKTWVRKQKYYYRIRNIHLEYSNDDQVFTMRGRAE
jgi:hypothetical protein